jgi:voltage-gated potassium channel
LRKRIFEIIESSNDNDKVSGFYDLIMMITIIVSIFPLAFKSTNTAFVVIDYVTVSIFIIDYILRLITADFKLNSKSPTAFILYIFTPLAIIDLISILPSITVLNSGFRLLKLFRLLRTAKVLRILKFVRYSKSIEIIMNVFKKEKSTLSAVATLAIVYVLISALVIFNVEPQSFDNYFDAVYWATVSLTTVGYGDIYPTSTIGRIVTMVSSILGIAIIALPSGIITGGYLNEINANKDNDK